MSHVRRSGRRRHIPSIDSLEPRRLYAATPAAWRIVGTPNDDTIVVRPNPTNARLLDTSVNGTVVASRPRAAVKFISVDAGDGNDSVTVLLAPRDRISVLVHGGAGNDTLTGSAKNDQLFGDDGDDTLSARAGADTLVGGSGADILSAGQDPDRDVLRSDTLDRHVTYRHRTDRISIGVVPPPTIVVDPPVIPIDAGPILIDRLMPIDNILIDLPTSDPLPTDYHRDVPTTAAASSVNAFGYDLYTQLRAAHPDDNLFFSPYSISAALGMAYAGSAGATRQQMADVLHLPVDQADFLAAFAADHSFSPGLRTEATVANALWAQDGLPLNPDYVAAVDSAFNADLHRLDFINDPDASREQINAAVSDQTHGRIPNLLPADAVTPDTRLVLTDAVYFKSDWARQFTGDQYASPFHSTPAASVNVKYMDADAYYHYTETSTLQLVEIPYAGGQYSMVIALPKAGSDLSTIAPSLSPDALNTLLASASVQDVNVTLPQFKLDASFGLATTLSDMGMPAAFTGTADFSGVDSGHDLSISAVVHKANIDVTPTGTEAAAATGIVIMPLAVAVHPAPRLFTADHPFYFAIRNTQTGATLFSGTLIHPDAAA